MLSSHLLLFGALATRESCRPRAGHPRVPADVAARASSSRRPSEPPREPRSLTRRGLPRHLVITGRSRLALYLARIPAGLSILLPLVAVAFAMVCLGDRVCGHPGRARRLLRRGHARRVRSSLPIIVIPPGPR